MTDYIKTENWKMLDDESRDLVDFAYGYMNTHKYCSRKFLSGLYLTKTHSYKSNDYRKHQNK